MKKFAKYFAVALSALLLFVIGGSWFVTSGARHLIPPAAAAGLETATFAGGCFWCMEPPFEKLAGVISVTAGYTGGKTSNPRYEEVSAGSTGHAESVRIQFDPAKVSYAQLLQVFWHNIDPTVINRQFCDSGSQYRTAIFYHNEAQKKLALQSKAALEKAKTFPEPLVTEITPAGRFYPAEEYHQDYYRKNPLRYKYYRYSCGRDKRLEELWRDQAGH